MLRRLAAIAIAFALLAIARPAAAQQHGFKRVTIDHVELSPSVLYGMVRMRIFANAIDLETGGSVLPVGGDSKTKTSWTIQGNSAIKKVPYLAGVFQDTDSEIAIAIVLQNSGEYANDLDTIKQSLHDDLLAPLEKREGVQVSVITYGSDVNGNKLGTVKAAEGQLESVAVDAPTDTPVMLDALAKAVTTLKKAKPTNGGDPSMLRRLVVLISDGRTAELDRDQVTRAGNDADRAGVRIDAIGYAPLDVRPPLLSLGELSKASNGVFRWIRDFPALTGVKAIDAARKEDAGTISGAFKMLHDEIMKEYVLTMFVAADDLPKKVSVTATVVDRELTSQNVKLPSTAKCAGEECSADQYCAVDRCVSRAHDEGRGILGWLAIIGGIVIGALALLIGVGFVLTKLKSRAPKAPPIAAAAPAAAPPAAPAPPVEGPGPKLLLLSGPETGRKINLRHGFTIGKAPGSDLSLAHDGYGSTNHAYINMDAAGNCQIVDNNSTNGTYINGVRITNSRLDDGMSVRCGSTELRFLQN